MSDKYLVFKLSDIRNLSNELKQKLIDVHTTIEAAHAAAGIPKQHYFTMNMMDQYAQVAIESYIEAIQRDGSAASNTGVEAAKRAAQEARTAGIMAGKPRLPTLPL